MRRPVPLLYVVYSLGHGGTERQAATLAQHLGPKGYQPHVASVHGGARADELRAQGIPLLALPIRSFADPGPVSITRLLRNYVREKGIRLVHTFDPGLSPFGPAVAGTMKGVHSLSSQRCYMELVPPKYRPMLIAAHWLGAGVVANCQAVRGHLHKSYKLPLSRISVCANGVDGSLFPSGPRIRLDPLRDADLVIGTACVLRAEKNVSLLIEAFERVRALRPRIKLLIVGSGPDQKNVAALCARLGIEEDCCLLPSTSNVAAALRSIDIFVLPSSSESMPNGLMEAMACGCSVIATNVGGCSELIDEGVHGLLIPPGNLDALASALGALILQSDLQTRLAHAASERMHSEFSIEAAAERMGAIYASILGISPACSLE